jgi:hypothetical protein
MVNPFEVNRLLGEVLSYQLHFAFWFWGVAVSKKGFYL